MQNDRPVLGAIADDVTGATDLAIALNAAGFRTTVLLEESLETRQDVGLSDAVVVALRTRSVAQPIAIAQSMKALRLLRWMNVEKFYFKYCSTFDSTPAGNIGPVLEAMLTAVGERFTVVVPSFPRNGRTVYQGNLFVGSQLLAESSMRNHPLNPMRDSNIVRLLTEQTTLSVGLVDLNVVAQGPSALKDALVEQSQLGHRLIVVDAVCEGDLHTIATATADMKLVSGSSGLAYGIRGPRTECASVDLISVTPPGIVLAGSASETTRKQTAFALANGSGLHMDISSLATDFEATTNLLANAALDSEASTFVIYSACDEVPVSSEYAALVEAAFARIATILVQKGVQALMVAGGETSGAVSRALGVRQLSMSHLLDPGVAWSLATLEDGSQINLALKSGNFGSTDLFSRAWEYCE